MGGHCRKVWRREGPAAADPDASHRISRARVSCFDDKFQHGETVLAILPWISKIDTDQFRKEEREIRHASPNFAEMLKPDPSAKDGCRAPMPGELMWNRNLANTFRLLARHGRKGFYEGPVADAYVKVVQDLGGSITHDDLKHHGNFGSEEVDAMSLEFKGQGIG